jgi:hypothetical protein
MKINMVFGGIDPQIIYIVNSTTVSDILNVVKLEDPSSSDDILSAGGRGEAIFHTRNVLRRELPLIYSRSIDQVSSPESYRHRFYIGMAKST